MMITRERTSYTMRENTEWQYKPVMSVCLPSSQ